jgi:hypothetical protein
MHWSCARLTFHSLMSTRSDPHWQKSSTGTRSVYPQANKKQNFVEMCSLLGIFWQVMKSLVRSPLASGDARQFFATRAGSYWCHGRRAGLSELREARAVILVALASP